LTEEDLATIFDELALVPSGFSDLAGSSGQGGLETEVIIGEGRDVQFPLLLSHPLLVAPGQMGAVNKSVRVASAYGASLAKTPVILGEGLLPEERKIATKFKGRFILPWSPFRLGADIKALKQAKAVVLDLGGMGLGQFFSQNELLDRIRGMDGLSEPYSMGPRSHLDLENQGDLATQVELLREATEHKVPIIVKTNTTAIYETTKMALSANCDAVLIDASTSPFSTPSSLPGTFGVALMGAIPPAVKAFKAEKASKKGIKLAVLGGYRNGADIVKALALGADCAGISEAALVAEGCVLCGECHVGMCKVGMATKDKELKSIFDWKAAGKKLANYIKALQSEIELLMDFSGVGNVQDLGAKHVSTLTYDAAAICGINLIGYDKELPMWFR
jgi:glutamate synthase domain-containing protein 2